MLSKLAHKIASSCRPNLCQDIFRTEGDIKILRLGHNHKDLTAACLSASCVAGILGLIDESL